MDCFLKEQVRLVEPPAFSVHTVQCVAVMLYLQQTQWFKKGADLGKWTHGSALIMGESDSGLILSWVVQQAINDLKSYT